jgi:hypothetical protein
MFEFVLTSFSDAYSYAPFRHLLDLLPTLFWCSHAGRIVEHIAHNISLKELHSSIETGLSPTFPDSSTQVVMLLQSK